MSYGLDIYSLSRSVLLRTDRRRWQGGIGIIHNNWSVEDQANDVRLVKRFKSGFILDPLCVTPSATLAEVDAVVKERGFTSFPVTETGKINSKLVGVITSRDMDFLEDRAQLVRPVFFVLIFRRRRFLSSPRPPAAFLSLWRNRPLRHEFIPDATTKP